MDPTRKRNLEVVNNGALSNPEKLDKLVELNKSRMWRPNMKADEQSELFMRLIARSTGQGKSVKTWPGEVGPVNYEAPPLAVTGGYLLRLFVYWPKQGYSPSILAEWSRQVGEEPASKLLKEYYKRDWITSPPKRHYPAAADMLLLLQQSVNAYEEAAKLSPSH